MTTLERLVARRRQVGPRIVKRLRQRDGLIQQTVTAAAGQRLRIGGRWVLSFAATNYLGQPQIKTSQRSRIAIAGCTVLNWPTQRHIMETTRSEFKALLLQIADEAEEWLMSADVLGIIQP